MTVRELLAELQGHDPDRFVVMANDGEGNSYSPLAELATGAYRAENEYRGEMGLERLTKAAREAGYGKEDVMKDGVPALCLWPVD